jgi:hypothetical protein
VDHHFWRNLSFSSFSFLLFDFGWLVAQKMATLYRFSRIAGRSCFIPSRNASVYVWGSSDNGQLGVGKVEKSGLMQSADGKFITVY